MKLTVMERLLLLQLLPQKEDIDTLRVVRDLKHSLSLSEDEHKEFEVADLEYGAITWNEKGREEREILIGEKATDVCIKALKDANKAKQLEEKHISLYDKFKKLKEEL